MNLTNNIIIVLITLTATHAFQLFVSKYGMDHALCGDETDPCGTLYQASIILNESYTHLLASNISHDDESEPFEIYVLDGQNATQIKRYITLNNTNNFDPCLPKAFSETQDIIITFKTQFITDIIDWYPYHTCNANYDNEYLFDGGKTLTIINLIINDYNIFNGSNHYPFIRSTLYFNTTLTCYNCSFVNITCDASVDALIQTFASLQLINTQFIDIDSVSNIILADREWLPDEASRLITMKRTLFANINTVESIVNIEVSNNDVGQSLNLQILNCDFHNISSENQIIYDEAYSAFVVIYNTRIHIIAGFIYYSDHQLDSTIDIKNISIVSNQLNVVHDGGYFRFNDIDDTTFEDVDIIYTYNVVQACSYHETTVNEGWNASSTTFICENPMKLLENEGQLVIDSVTFDMIIFTPDTFAHNETHYYQFRYKGSMDASFIHNKGTMMLRNVAVKHSACKVFITNEHEAEIINLTFDNDRYLPYDPNVLHSVVLIYHTGSTTITTIEHCYMIGSEYILFAIQGSVEMFNSTFERTLMVMQLRALDDFLMDSCIVQHMGRYNGRFKSDPHHDVYITSGIQTFNAANNLLFVNNHIKGYDPKGLMVFIMAQNVVFINNTIEVDRNMLFFNVPKEEHGFEWRFAPIVMYFVSNTTMIDNSFINNIVDPSVPWIKYWDTTGVNCISGNTFMNAAIYINNTNITSCFRPNLVDYVQARDNITDATQVYGYMDDVSLLHTTGYFITNHDHEGTILVVNGNFALDNVYISNPIIVFGERANILFIDSYIANGSDITYNAYDCNVMNNNRLFNQNEHIAKLWIRCDDDYGNNTSNMMDDGNKTMESTNTKLVHHLNAVAINISAETSTYFPGQLMKLTYNVMDKIGTVFEYRSPQIIQFHLKGHSFSFATDITIESGDICEICESGVLINTVSIHRDINGLLTMDISIKDDILYAINSQFSMNITGCPIGSGPDSNNASCIKCNTDSYNLQPHNVELCESCNPDENNGVKCVDGSVNLESDHWMGFHEGTLISAVCPLGYCCTKAAGCDYDADNKQALCALNRDYKSILCSRCNDGFSESMNSTKCVQCKRHYYEYLLWPLLFTVLICIFLLYISMVPVQKDAGKEDNHNMKTSKSKFKLMVRSPYYKVMIKIMMLKNIAYYQQSVSQLMITSPYKIYFRAVAANFNFDNALTSVVSNNDKYSWCFINGLTAKWKILVDLVIPVMIIISIIILGIVSKYIIKRGIGTKKRRVSFTKAFVTMYLVVIGKILDVLFRIMSCQKVGDFDVHYYFGNESCYTLTWWIAASALAVILISFSIIFIKLRFIPSSERQNRDHRLYRFTARYKPQYYQWEFVIFCRRIFIALFAVNVQNTTVKFLFIGILMCFLYLQISCQPFIIHEANQMETQLLIALIFMSATKMSNDININVLNVVSSFLIILPFPLLMYYIFGLYRSQVIGKEKKLSDLIDITSNRATKGSDTRNLKHTEKTNNKNKVELHKIDSPMHVAQRRAANVVHIEESSDENLSEMQAVARTESDLSYCDDVIVTNVFGHIVHNPVMDRKVNEATAKRDMTHASANGNNIASNQRNTLSAQINPNDTRSTSLIVCVGSVPANDLRM